MDRQRRVLRAQASAGSWGEQPPADRGVRAVAHKLIRADLAERVAAGRECALPHPAHWRLLALLRGTSAGCRTNVHLAHRGSTVLVSDS
jgi:hypothetical protein